MLKISTDVQAGTVVLVLEGSLSGPWVQEVEHTWETTVGDQGFGRTRLDLSGLTFVSSEGKKLLEKLVAGGVELISSDVLTKSIVSAISRKRGQEK